jgi:hypothetical protein
MEMEAKVVTNPTLTRSVEGARVERFRLGTPPSRILMAAALLFAFGAGYATATSRADVSTSTLSVISTPVPSGLAGSLDRSGALRDQAAAHAAAERADLPGVPTFLDQVIRHLTTERAEATR